MFTPPTLYQSAECKRREQGGSPLASAGGAFLSWSESVGGHDAFIFVHRQPLIQAVNR
jgi:hypothetical protein